ncbi:hypothetical protein PLICBS_004185 [Purpureocillium lilacinum]|uniref:uncharacterized protein n=1 Tax=Purpureocillium lilacinum TaxID=33203 RepID=UPI0020815104|nr:hypothetical protein PLICBS_004185 [Purpureocillium lilacinum]
MKGSDNAPSSVKIFYSSSTLIKRHREPKTHRDVLPPLLDATPEDFRAGLDARRFTSVDPVKAYIAHMEEVAVTEIDPDSLSVAPMLDPIRRGADNALSLEALHGIPVLLNGNMATDDGMNTTADSSALLGAQPKRDTTVAAKLRKPLPCSGRPICHTRIIKGATYLLSAVIGRDSHVNYARIIPFEDEKKPDYVAAYETAIPALGIFNSTLLLGSAGAIIIDDVRVPGVEALLRTKPTRVKCDADPTSPDCIHNCTAMRHYVGELDLTRALRNHSLDAIAMPAASPDDTPVRQSGDGTSPNVPYGPEFAGDKFSETKAFAMAYACEQRTRVRGSIEPYVRPTTELTEVVRR